jgi:rhodanese-related sulfurtransferase
MNLRRHLLEAATLAVVAVAVALVSNALASRERKLKLPGDYPNATVVTNTPAAGGFSAPVQTATPASSPAKAQQGSTGSSSKGESPAQAASPVSSPAAAQRGSGSFSSKVNRGPAAAPAEPAGAAVPPAAISPSKELPVGVSPAPPATAEAELLSRFPPHPDKPYVDITGEEAARLYAAGVPFLDARRTSAFEEGHVAGARPFSVWESDIDEKVMALIAERDGAQPLVVYCSGGDCEDSHLLAEKLWGAGFNDNLVYRDGFPDWVRRGGAIRTGPKP